MSLALFAPVLERIEQLRVHSCQASQVLGVYLIGLLLVSVDESQLTGVGHQDLVTALLEQPTNPRRVSPGLDGHAHRPLRSKASLQSFGGGSHPTLLDHLAAVGVQKTQIAVFVAEIHSGRHLWSYFATIHSGPILLSGPLEPVEPLQTQRVLRRGSAFSSHLPRIHLPGTGDASMFVKALKSRCYVRTGKRGSGRSHGRCIA